MVDHVHTCISIPPKYSVSKVIGYMQGKNAIAIARPFSGRERNVNVPFGEWEKISRLQA
jgi:putative transposase